MHWLQTFPGLVGSWDSRQCSVWHRILPDHPSSGEEAGSEQETLACVQRAGSRSPVSHRALYHPHCPGTCSCRMFTAPCVIQAGFVPGNLPLSHPRRLLTTPTQAVSTSCHILILNILIFCFPFHLHSSALAWATTVSCLNRDSMLLVVLPALSTLPVQPLPYHGGTFPKWEYECAPSLLHPSCSRQGARHPWRTDPLASFFPLIFCFLGSLWGLCQHACPLRPLPALSRDQ